MQLPSHWRTLACNAYQKVTSHSIVDRIRLLECYSAPRKRADQSIFWLHTMVRWGDLRLIDSSRCPVRGEDLTLFVLHYRRGAVSADGASGKADGSGSSRCSQQPLAQQVMRAPFDSTLTLQQQQQQQQQQQEQNQQCQHQQLQEQQQPLSPRGLASQSQPTLSRRPKRECNWDLPSSAPPRKHSPRRRLAAMKAAVQHHWHISSVRVLNSLSRVDETGERGAVKGRAGAELLRVAFGWGPLLQERPELGQDDSSWQNPDTVAAAWAIISAAAAVLPPFPLTPAPPPVSGGVLTPGLPHPARTPVARTPGSPPPPPASWSHPPGVLSPPPASASGGRGPAGGGP